MPTHDIIDNRKEILADHINQILCSTESGRFAVGYFFLSGLTSIAENLKNVSELKLLIGNTTNRETLEQLAEGYRRLELVRDKAEEQAYPKKTEARQMTEDTASNLRSSAELMDQTDEAESLDKNLGLKQKLQNRIQEIHDTIGEDSAILDRTEQLNEEAMYAIYEKKGGQLSLFEDAEDELVDLNEAEEILRQLRNERPEEYERIAGLRDGIRTGKVSGIKGLYVFCQAGRYQQLFQIDEAGNMAIRDIPRILGSIKCGWDFEAQKLPD
ncbi:MAG: hypothetical protein JXA46_13725 [Dehalococcoidales bacterium]|nr:hypothetical protein [Dehalococcoidales bacterium]